MIEIIYSFVKRIIFWLLVFAWARIVFLIYFARLIKAENIGLNEVIPSFWHALPLDIATACYFMVFTFLITLAYLVFRRRFLKVADKVYMLICLIIFFLITGGELGIYNEWRTKLNYKALLYLKHPAEIYQSVSTFVFVLLVVLVMVQVAIWYFIYLRFFQLIQNRDKLKWIPFLLFLILTPPILFIGLRGGIDEIPINQGKSYYSRHIILNHAAVNSANSLAKSILENFHFRHENPYQFISLNEAEQIVKSLYDHGPDTTISILNNKRPNIVLILLEGWSADAIESLGGDSGIAPNFKKLETKGILFTGHYASGNRSDQGNVSVISGFPATPVASIGHNPDKSQKLPSMVRTLKSAGYTSSYYFGGQLIYGGLQSYVVSAGFDYVFEMSDYENRYPRGKLGIHDEYMLMEQLSGISSLPEPFFSMIFTVSSHSPYDYPGRTEIPFAGLENDYLNSIYYADKCLGQYFAKAEVQPWFKNTLFILVSDHGHSSQKNRPFESKEYRKIPMLFYGPVIRDEFMGTQMAVIGSQHDIASTLLHQLKLPAGEFRWSRNLFNPEIRQFISYEAGESFGWISDEGSFVYDRNIDAYSYLEILPDKKEQVTREGRAYMQVLFQEYLDY